DPVPRAGRDTMGNPVAHRDVREPRELPGTQPQQHGRRRLPGHPLHVEGVRREGLRPQRHAVPAARHRRTHPQRTGTQSMGVRM
ncbi:MAG: hypothetical protein AVDCRST_MAG68-2074, partial [uncultured Gemmatimonadetes bacterium]